MRNCKSLRVLAACAALAILGLNAGPLAQTRPRHSTNVAARRAKLDRHLQQRLERGGGPTERVIIRPSAGRATNLQSLLQTHGDRVKPQFSVTDAFAAEVHGEDLAWLAASDDVERISADARVHGATDLESTASLLVVRQTLGLSSWWTGDGIGIALVDSGVERSDDFGKRLAGSYDFTASPVANTVGDDFGHGTHVAGLAGGDGRLSTAGEFMGMAPKARLISLRVLAADGSGYTSDVIEAIEFAVRNRATLKIHVLNLSLGHPIFEPAAEDPLVRAVESAVRAGLVVVVAAGNYGRSLESVEPAFGGITSPGNAPSAITVGAVNTRGTISRADDYVAAYSSRGPTWYDGYAKPDLVAPGHGLGATASSTSTLYVDYPTLRITNQPGPYLVLSGTSMAAAVTSGVIAQMLQASRAANGAAAPLLSAHAVKAALQYTALPVLNQDGTAADELAAGAGSLNGAGAVLLARAMKTSTAVGGDWLNTSVIPAQPTTTIGGVVYAWKKTIVWGTNLVTGSTVMVNHPAWATTIAWGANDPLLWSSAQRIVWGTAKTVVWGTNVVWDTPDRWASSVVWGSTAIGVVDSMKKTIVWGTTTSLTQETAAWADLSDATWNPSPNAAALTFDPLR